MLVRYICSLFTKSNNKGPAAFYSYPCLARNRDLHRIFDVLRPPTRDSNPRPRAFGGVREQTRQPLRPFGSSMKGVNGKVGYVLRLVGRLLKWGVEDRLGGELEWDGFTTFF